MLGGAHCPLLYKTLLRLDVCCLHVHNVDHLFSFSDCPACSQSIIAIDAEYDALFPVTSGQEFASDLQHTVLVFPSML